MKTLTVVPLMLFGSALLVKEPALARDTFLRYHSSFEGIRFEIDHNYSSGWDLFGYLDGSHHQRQNALTRWLGTGFATNAIRAMLLKPLKGSLAGTGLDQGMELHIEVAYRPVVEERIRVYELEAKVRVRFSGRDLRLTHFGRVFIRGRQNEQYAGYWNSLAREIVRTVSGSCEMQLGDPYVALAAR